MQTTQNAVHADDLAVDRFAAAMKAKMSASRAKGRDGWNNPDLCPVERLQGMLLDHLAKGDPVDIGNFAMMLWNRDAPVSAHGNSQRDLLPPLNIRNDRDMLIYLTQAFASEMSVCKCCGESESTEHMDSAGFLREYLAAAPAQPETWKVSPSPARVTGEMLHQAFPEIPGEPWALPARRKAIWERYAERVNARLAGEPIQEAKE